MLLLVIYSHTQKDKSEAQRDETSCIIKTSIKGLGRWLGGSEQVLPKDLSLVPSPCQVTYNLPSPQIQGI